MKNTELDYLIAELAPVTLGKVAGDAGLTKWEAFKGPDGEDQEEPNHNHVDD